MTFAEVVALLSQGLGANIEIESDACAVRADARGGTSVTVLLQGFDARGVLLMTADLGAPPPERLERLFRTLLEANDLFRDTGGMTLSLSPDTGHVRLQRFESFGALAEIGPEKTLFVFANVAADWMKLVRDYRDAPDDDEQETQDESNIFVFRV